MPKAAMFPWLTNSVSELHCEFTGVHWDSGCRLGAAWKMGSTWA